MFYDGGYMVGMHAWWWMFWVVVIAVMLFSFRGRSGDRSQSGFESPRTILQRRLAAGDITPQQYEEHKALLDRDAGAHRSP